MCRIQTYVWSTTTMLTNTLKIISESKICIKWLIPTNIIINVKMCLSICLLSLHGLTTGQISTKIGREVPWSLTKDIGYIIFTICSISSGENRIASANTERIWMRFLPFDSLFLQKGLGLLPDPVSFETIKFTRANI